jgi:hypothetical protein
LSRSKAKQHPGNTRLSKQKTSKVYPTNFYVVPFCKKSEMTLSVWKSNAILEKATKFLMRAFKKS